MISVKRFLTFLFVIAAASCIDPYIPNLKDYKSLIVIEGLITDENISNKIILSRTFPEAGSEQERISDANVYITDANGVRTQLYNCGNGCYKTDSTSFRGSIGQKYSLHVFTVDGKEYESSECTMFPVPDIDTLFYEKGDEISGISGELVTGINIFLNSADAGDMDQYYRWTFEEVWKTILPSPQQQSFEVINDTTFSFKSLPQVIRACWKKNLSGNIITNSTFSDGVHSLKKQNIQFIASDKSDRLSSEYGIVVNQYSISREEYDFWNNLKKVSESGGDIFDSQPYTVEGNIKNVNDRSELVLGYFEVSAVSRKGMTVTAQELDHLALPHFTSACVQIAKSPDDWPFPPRPTWDEIYHMYIDHGEYIFVAPVLTPGTIPEGNVSIRNLVKLLFTPRACALCEYPGSVVKPE
jgi:Domain of unknown function (DUF4249)